MPCPPLSTPLSHLLVAFTIEFDNEFERRFTEAGVGRRFGISMVMWSNFMRFVNDGITVGELPVVAGLPRARTLSTLGGMERWRYVEVGSEAAGPKRDGWGSARGLRQDWVVRPTAAGRAAQEIWPPLFDEVETRWEERFGADEICALRQSLEAVIWQLDVELPEYLPIVSGTNGMAADIVPRERQATREGRLPTLLAQALLAYTLDFERASDVSLPLHANFLRVLDETGLDGRELPAVAGVSKEATAMALTFLTKTGSVVVEKTKLVRLTPRGRELRQGGSRLQTDIEQGWETRYGAANVHRLRAALRAVLDQRDGDRAPRLSQGLHPYPDGWRAAKGYLEHTNAVISDPSGRLPHYPMVLHRGGWPDGS